MNGEIRIMSSGGYWGLTQNDHQLATMLVFGRVLIIKLINFIKNHIKIT